MSDAVTIINRSGGSAGDDAEERVRAALAAAGVATDVFTGNGRECAQRAAEAVRRGVRLVIAAGGDGTISAAAGALAGTDTTLGVLPLGTLNHFARDLGIPLDLGEAAHIIAARRELAIDVAEMDGRVFVNNSAVGLYPLMVLDREAQRRRLGRNKRLALVVAAIRTLARFNRQRLALTVNDREASVDTPLLFVGNNNYSLSLPGAGTRGSLSDGELCVLVLRKKTRAGFLAASLRALIGRARGDDMVRLEGVERLRVDSRSSPLTISIDGEVLRAAPPIEYRIRPHALKVLIPG